MSAKSFAKALIGTAYLCVVSLSASAITTVVVQDNFTGKSATNTWIPFNGACLTAGDGTGSIPACSNTDYLGKTQQGGTTGTLPDTAGQGALRLTNTANNETGAIIITPSQAFPLSAGVQVTFTTMTYIGDSGGSGQDGADGISFFLMDAAKTPNIGSWGGSLGYTCSNSNTPYTGMWGAYLGLGIDEYGNFLNQGDNTASGYGAQPGRIGLRGAGSISFPALTAAYGSDPGDSSKPYYPASLALTCQNGAYDQATGNCQTAICSTGSVYNPVNGDCEAPICSSGYLFNSANNSCQTPVCSTGSVFNPTTSACAAPICSSGTVFNSANGTCGTPSCATGYVYNSTKKDCETPVCPSSYAFNSTNTDCETPVCTSGEVFVSSANKCETPKCSNSGTYNFSTKLCSKGTLSYGNPTGSPTGYTTPVTAFTGYTTPTGSATFGSPSGTLSYGSASGTLSYGTTGTLNYGGTPTGTLSYGTVTGSTPYSVLAVQNTCKSGNLFNYKAPGSPISAGAATLANTKNTAGILDYAPIPNAYQVLPSGQQIANESATTRGDAIPITYQLKITQAGLLSFNYSYNGGVYNPIITNQDITAANGPLPQNLLFGFAGSTGGSRNIHEISCFKAQPAEQSASSASLNIQETAKITTSTQVYLAFYNQTYWSGQLTAQYLVYDPSTQIVSANPVANWDASCVLTGGACNAMSTSSNTVNITAESPSSRTILSWSGTQGIPFEWGTNPGANGITTAQQTTLDQGDATPLTANRLSFLRGDRSNEITTSGSGLFRARNSVLGDIIHASPTWVGPAVAPFSSTWVDTLYSSATVPENASSAQTYAQFLAAEATRLNVVYAGANDGMMHGFRSGSYDTSGNYVANSTTPNDGKEVLAYMPGAILNTIHNATNPALDYSNTQYAHNFYVDATPARGDLFYGGAWHTWLVGGLASGGSAIYALDITNPANFSEANASSLVIGEWTTAMACAGNSTCGAKNLGNTYGTPAIRRLHNGQWGVIFGNGYQSVSGSAGLFIMTVDPTSGSTTSYYLDTGYGPSQDPLHKNNFNGIYYVSPVDLDGDNVVDYVYAGDLFGNIWRFDLTDNNPSHWKATSAPLFSTPAGQPITTQVLPVILSPKNGSPQRLLIEFGTGQEIPQTTSSAPIDSSSQQAMYGVWDWNMSAWNTLSPANQFASLSSSTAPTTLATTNLQQQKITGSGTIAVTGVSANTGLTETSNPVCWQGSTYCATGDTQYGWYLNLATSTTSAGYEETIYSPALISGAFVVNSTIPPTNSPTLCTSNTAQGFTYALDPSTGGPEPAFFLTPAGKVITINANAVAGLGTNGVGTAFGVTVGTGTTNMSGIVLNGPSGLIFLQTGKPNYKGSRITWTQKR